LKWSCPQTSQAESLPLFMYLIIAFLLFFECNGSGRALNQVKPNHFPSFHVF
jgi:hypothetical protein